MTKLNIVGFAGSASRPSRTRNLVEAIATATAERTRAEVSIYDLNEIHPSLGSTLDPRTAPADLRELIAEITAADALIVGSPVYKGTYTGLFKHLFDLIEPQALKDKPIVLSATGGSERHALVVDHGLEAALRSSSPPTSCRRAFTAPMPTSHRLSSRAAPICCRASSAPQTS